MDYNLTLYSRAMKVGVPLTVTRAPPFIEPLASAHSPKSAILAVKEAISITLLNQNIVFAFLSVRDVLWYLLCPSPCNLRRF